MLLRIQSLPLIYSIISSIIKALFLSASLAKNVALLVLNKIISQLRIVSHISNQKDKGVIPISPLIYKEKPQWQV